MKLFSKATCIFIGFILFISIAGMNVYSKESKFEIKINGKKINYSLSPYVKNNKVYFPLRETFELFGFSVNWNRNKEIYCSNEDSNIIFKVSSKNMLINKKNYLLSSAIVNTNNSTWIPSDVIKTVLNLDVTVDLKEKTINLWIRNSEIFNIIGSNNNTTYGDNIIARINKIPKDKNLIKLIEDANKLFDDSSYYMAIKKYEKILTAISTKSDPELYFYIAEKLGNAYYELSMMSNKEKNLDKSIALLENTIKKIPDVKYNEIRALAYKCLVFDYIAKANIRNGKENIEKALSYIDKSLKIFDADKYPLLFGRLKGLKARAYLNLSYAENNLDYLSKAIAESDTAFLYITKKKFPKEYANLKKQEAEILIKEYLTNDDLLVLEKAKNSLIEAAKLFKEQKEPYHYGIVKFQQSRISEYTIPRKPSKELFDEGITALDDALTVFSEDEYPFMYAYVKNQMGYLNVVMSYHSSDIKYCNDAIKEMSNALRVFSLEDYPDYYASLESDLGCAYYSLSIRENSSESADLSIAHFKNALKIFSLTKFPRRYASTNIELAKTYSSKPHDSNVQKSYLLALDCLSESLKVYTDNKSTMHAYTKLIMGGIYVKLASTNYDLNTCTKKGIEASNDALTVFKQTNDNYLASLANSDLGDAYYYLFKTSNNKEDILNSITFLKNALEFLSKKDYTSYYSSINKRLGDDYLELSKIENMDQNKKKSIEHYKEALEYYTVERDKAKNQEILSILTSIEG